MRIVFMGTPEFAVPSLEILVEHGYDIPVVITAPDKPGGRLGLQESAVKQFALTKNLEVWQPQKLRDSEFLNSLREIKADLQVVVAFRMLPEAIWAMPRMGTLNLHASLLPQYRGAAPINWAIINGETETGLTTFLLKHEIDTGDILFQERISIGPNETAGELYARMMPQGAKLVLRTVQALEAGTAKSFPQDITKISHAPKIFTETCRIDFNKKCEEVHNFIRGLSPYPGAWTMLGEDALKIFATNPEPLSGGQNSPDPGKFYSYGKKKLLIGTKNGYINILELQLAGKKRMLAQNFLAGYKQVEQFTSI